WGGRPDRSGMWRVAERQKKGGGGRTPRRVACGDRVAERRLKSPSNGGDSSIVAPRRRPFADQSVGSSPRLPSKARSARRKRMPPPKRARNSFWSWAELSFN